MRQTLFLAHVLLFAVPFGAALAFAACAPTGPGTPPATSSGVVTLTASSDATTGPTGGQASTGDGTSTTGGTGTSTAATSGDPAGCVPDREITCAPLAGPDGWCDDLDAIMDGVPALNREVALAKCQAGENPCSVCVYAGSACVDAQKCAGLELACRCLAAKAGAL